ncbi:MAG: hypothetical protein KDK55_02830 [Chlamydiia bacterium]|nr:hypothetical protein [Chlamydiia bacterium]
MQQKAFYTSSQVEKEIHRLVEELRTINIAHQIRMELEQRLNSCFIEVKNVGEEDVTGLKKIETEINEIDELMAFEAVYQAEQEISKRERHSSEYMGLENIRKDLESDTITPSEARHAIKEIMRHH